MLSPVGYYAIFYCFIVTVISLMSKVKLTKRLDILLSIFIFLLACVLLTIRDPLNPNDSFNYSIMYSEINNFESIFNAYHGNYLFSFTQYLSKLLNLNYSEYAILLSIFCVFLTWFSFFKIFQFNHAKQLLAFGFFVTSSTFILLYTNVIRQGLSLAFIFISLSYFLDKKFLLFFIFSVCAFFSHSSSIIFPMALLIGGFFNISVNKTRVLLLYSILFPLLGYLLLKVIGGYFEKIDSLSSMDYDNSLVYIKIIILYITAWLVYFSIKKSNSLIISKKFYVIYNTYCILIALILLFSPILLLASRIIYYASSLMPILFAMLVFDLKNINVNYRFFITLIIFFIYSYISLFYPSTANQLGIYE